MSLIYSAVEDSTTVDSTSFSYFDPQRCIQCPIVDQSVFGFTIFPQRISPSIVVKRFIDKAARSLVSLYNKKCQPQNFAVRIISPSWRVSKRSAYGTDLNFPMIFSVFISFTSFKTKEKQQISYGVTLSFSFYLINRS